MASSEPTAWMPTRSRPASGPSLGRYTVVVVAPWRTDQNQAGPSGVMATPLGARSGRRRSPPRHQQRAIALVHRERGAAAESRAFDREAAAQQIDLELLEGGASGRRRQRHDPEQDGLRLLDPRRARRSANHGGAAVDPVTRRARPRAAATRDRSHRRGRSVRRRRATARRRRRRPAPPTRRRGAPAATRATGRPRGRAPLRGWSASPRSRALAPNGGTPPSRPPAPPRARRARGRRARPDREPSASARRCDRGSPTTPRRSGRSAPAP